MTNLASSAPHIHGATTYADLVDWGVQPDAIVAGSTNTGRLLHKGPEGRPEVGVWVCTPGEWRLSIPRDEFCHFVAGRATYTRDTGDVIDIEPNTAVMFPAGWTGTCKVHATIRNLYMLTGDDTLQTETLQTPLMQYPLKVTDLVDWGTIPTMIEGTSHVSGRLLHKGPNGQSECGLWICTPGVWACHVTRDEFCHFLAGRCTYVHESGDVIEVTPDTAAFFPQDWKGVCTITETIKKVYMIR